jgi:hypothetical protein
VLSIKQKVSHGIDKSFLLVRDEDPASPTIVDVQIFDEQAYEPLPGFICFLLNNSPCQGIHLVVGIPRNCTQQLTFDNSFKETAI